MSKADEFGALPFELVVDEDDIIGINGAAEIGYWARENRALIARALRRDAMIEDPTPEIVEIVERAMDNPWLAGGEDVLLAFGKAVK